jgi:integrase
MGARRGELLNLHWSDIDLDGKKITIAGSTGITSAGGCAQAMAA